MLYLIQKEAVETGGYKAGRDTEEISRIPASLRRDFSYEKVLQTGACRNGSSRKYLSAAHAEQYRKKITEAIVETGRMLRMKKTEEITIPASLIKFSSSDLQDNIEAFSDYCTSVRQDGDDMIIEVTTEQKETLIQMHEDNIREVMDDMVEADPSYSCELDEDYSRVVVQVRRNIDGILQAKFCCRLPQAML